MKNIKKVLQLLEKQVIKEGLVIGSIIHLKADPSMDVVEGDYKIIELMRNNSFVLENLEDGSVYTLDKDYVLGTDYWEETGPMVTHAFNKKKENNLNERASDFPRQKEFNTQAVNRYKTQPEISAFIRGAEFGYELKEREVGDLEESKASLKVQGKKPIMDAEEVGNDVDPEVSAKLEKLAKLHFANEKKFNAIQEQIDALYAEQAKYSNSEVDSQIEKMLKAIKGKSIQFGKIILKYTEEKQTYFTKTAISYKGVVEKLIETYKIETKVIDKLYKDFDSGNLAKTRVNKELTITKESVSLNEGIGSWVKSLYSSLVSFIKGDYKKYSSNISELEDMLQTA